MQSQTKEKLAFLLT